MEGESTCSNAGIVFEEAIHLQDFDISRLQCRTGTKPQRHVTIDPVVWRRALSVDIPYSVYSYK